MKPQVHCSEPHSANRRGCRILLSEGASTSARQAITALGLRGYEIEVCDPDPRCLGRFSRFVSRFHRCPALGADPAGYLSFILDLIVKRSFDVLLPIHEQGFLFAKVLEELKPHVALALPSFTSYERAHSKTGFNQLLSELGLPQPRTQHVTTPRQLSDAVQFPSVVKTAIGTASRGTWIIHGADELEQAADELEACGGFEDIVLVQDFIPGPVEHAQAVFSKGRLVGLHMYRQIVRGAGGGDAVKESVRRPDVRAHLIQIGECLAWHGALSVDYICNESDNTPYYIDCNPRLVEPMSAFLSGANLADLLVRVSLGEEPECLLAGEAGTRSHLAIQALLACAARSGSRGDVLRECYHLATGRGAYSDSQEELTPLTLDWPSVVAPITAGLWLLSNPGAAHTMPKTGWGTHLLNTESVRAIRKWDSSSSAIMRSRETQEPRRP